MSQTKYFTTPIYYVNGKPHIGTAYCTLAADMLARYWRQKIGTENVYFLTGTDENSQKTVEAAAKVDKDVDIYLKEMADDFRAAFENINISFDDFIRTTEDRHVKTSQEIAKIIYDNGDIYEGTYKGKYCTGCEAFYKPEDLTEEGYCPVHLKPAKDIEEQNYFFRLSKYTEPLLEFYAQNPNWLQPEKRKNEIVSFLKEGLEDISISREGAQIGIPLPWDPEHKMYVWFEAVINYYSAINTPEKNHFWSGVTHIIGKDITRFHCIIWPAMLMSAGLPLPEGVFAHGFFTVNGHKMSKSLGNVVDPLDLSAEYGNDALRLGLLDSFEFGNDGDFSAENFGEFYRTKLAGGVGNLFNRVVVLIHKFLDGQKPTMDGELLDETKQKVAKIKTAMENKKLKEAIDTYFALVDQTNELLNETEVWKLAKTDLEKSKTIFAILLQNLGKLAYLAEFLLPETYPKMKAMLGDAKKVGEKQILFPQK